MKLSEEDEGLASMVPILNTTYDTVNSVAVKTIRIMIKFYTNWLDFILFSWSLDFWPKTTITMVLEKL